MKKYLLRALIFITPLLFISACSMVNQAVVKPDGSGEVSFDVSVRPFLIDTMKEMATLSGEENDLPEGHLFDITQIQKDFAAKETVTLKEVCTPKPEHLQGNFAFDDIGVLFQKEKELTEAGIITVTKTGSQTVLNFHLEKSNFAQVATLFPIVETPLFEMFGPQKGEKITEEEYYEMVALAFGEAGAEGLKDSRIELRVKVKGEVVRQTGGTVEGNTVIFSIPLVKVLLLNEPLDYSIVFK